MPHTEQQRTHREIDYILRQEFPESAKLCEPSVALCDIIKKHTYFVGIAEAPTEINGKCTNIYCAYYKWIT